jgi:serine/threonine-protein kinase
MSRHHPFTTPVSHFVPGDHFQTEEALPSPKLAHTKNGPVDPPPADAAALVGSSLGDRYRLLELIGQGGIGWVFRAEQIATGREVALKLLRPEMAHAFQIAQRFVREAHVTERLAHRNIVKIVDFGELDGRMFLAMELLTGVSLARVIERGDAPRRKRRQRRQRLSGTGARGGGLGVARTVAIMSQVLNALEKAHAIGVVHRDLKPENVMLLPPRWPFGRERVKLLDFGIAKLLDTGGGAQQLTQLGIAMGTPLYMSPEQAMGHATDARSDVYACGVMLYEMLTGRPPFEADSTPELLTLHLTRVPRPLRTVAPEAAIPVAMESVVLRALAKSPGARYQSARELRQALERALRARDRLGEISGLETTGVAVTPPATQPRWLRAGIAAASLGLVGATLLMGNGHCLQPVAICGAAPVSSGHKIAAPASSPPPALAVARPAPAMERPAPAVEGPAPTVAHAAAEPPRNAAPEKRTPAKRARARKR